MTSESIPKTDTQISEDSANRKNVSDTTATSQESDSGFAIGEVSDIDLKKKRLGLLPLKALRFSQAQVNDNGQAPYGAHPQTLLIAAKGSVCDFTGDAMVNAANEGCITGGGIDGEITRQGGPTLKKARLELPIINSQKGPNGAKGGGSGPGIRCPCGEARITIGGDLNTPWCIHAVGPNYRVQCDVHNMSLEDCDNIVSSAYFDSLQRAREKNLKTVAFSLISCGVFRGEQSLEKVLHAGIRGIVKGAYPGLEEVYMVAFTNEEVEALSDEMNNCVLKLQSKSKI